MSSLGLPESGGDARHAFGKSTLGPILAEFAMRLWLYQRFLPQPDRACLLFCARGGLRLHLAYERFLARTGLPPILPARDLMVSRLVAARTTMASPTDGLLSELGREFAGRPMSEVAHALAQRTDLDLPDEWTQTYGRDRFVRLLQGPDAGTSGLRDAIARQDQAFRRHLTAIADGRTTVLLCDTGLYGSTVRLLREGVPDKDWVGLQFARSNYKGFETPHFHVTVGLSVEQDCYAPWNVRTAALRFWQLIEAMLEPDLASVRSFSDEANPRSNLEIEGWRERITPAGTDLFSGALAHLDGLDPAALPHVSMNADAAWRRLKRAVIWPRRDRLAALALPDRSRDFGRIEVVAQFAADAAGIRDSLWREGAVMRRHPHVAPAVLGMLELAHTGRALARTMAILRPRRRRSDRTGSGAGLEAGT